MDQTQKGREDGSRRKSYQNVRLGLVDVKIVIEELKTEEMQRVPEVNMHLQESIIRHCMPSHEFAAEKTRSMRPVGEKLSSLIASFNYNAAFVEISLVSLQYTEFHNN